MTVVRLPLFGLLLALLVPTPANACECFSRDPESLMRDGSIVARVLVLEKTRTFLDSGSHVSATAFVQESFSGPFPNRVIEIEFSDPNSSLCDFHIYLNSVGTSGLVVLDPSVRTDDLYHMYECADAPLHMRNTTEVLERFARLREEEGGVWIDTVAFNRLLQTRPELSAVREAFPEVEIIPHEDAPAELQVTCDDIWQAEWDSNVDLRARFRPDQSRFIADVSNGRVYGGEFR